MIETLHQWIGREGEAISWWQMSLRGCLVFLIGVGIVRIAATRAFGKWSALDIILAVVVGSNLGRAMTGNAPFVATLAATLVLVLLHAGLTRASAQWSWLSVLTKGRAIVLVENGAALEGAMRRAGIGERDLSMALRASGYDRLEQVRTVFLERNGQISVVPRDGGAQAD